MERRSRDRERTEGRPHSEARPPVGHVRAASILAFVLLIGQVSAATASPAAGGGGSAYGLSANDSTGSVLIVQTSTAAADVAGTSHDETDVVFVGATGVVGSATLHAEADASVSSTVLATLQSSIVTSASPRPATWDTRGYSSTQSL